MDTTISTNGTFFTRLQRAALNLNSPRWQPLVYAMIGGIILAAFAVLPDGFDYYHYFHRLATGCVDCTYYPYFTEWFVRPLGWFTDWRVAYIVMCGVSMIGLYAAAKRLGGNPFVALFSFTFFWSMWLGMLDTLPVIGLALAWWGVGPGQTPDESAMTLKSPIRRFLAGFGLLMMATKPQMTGIALVALLWWGLRDGYRANGWRGASQILLLPVAAAVVSFLLYGIDWVPRWLSYTPQTVFKGEAWFYISAPVLLIGLVGVLWIKGRREQLQYIVAVSMAGMPLLGAYSFFILTVFRLRWWEVVAGYIAFPLMGLGENQYWLGLLMFQPLLIMARLLVAPRLQLATTPPDAQPPTPYTPPVTGG